MGWLDRTVVCQWSHVDEGHPKTEQVKIDQGSCSDRAAESARSVSTVPRFRERSEGIKPAVSLIRQIVSRGS